MQLNVAVVCVCCFGVDDCVLVCVGLFVSVFISFFVSLCVLIACFCCCVVAAVALFQIRMILSQKLIILKN